MAYDIHPLSDHLSLVVDYFLNDCVDHESNIEIEINPFDIHHSIPDDTNFHNDIGEIGKFIENPPLAIQPVLKTEQDSKARNRAFIYDVIYNNYMNSVDIGCGKFNKGFEPFRSIQRYNGPKRLLLDIIDQPDFPPYSPDAFENSKVVFRKFDMNSEKDQEFLEKFLKENEDFMITSTNSLMHKLDDLSPFDNYDMIYTLPDPRKMLKSGMARMKNDKTYIFAVTGEEEQAHFEKLNSEPNEMQSLAINLTRRSVVLKKVVNKTPLMEQKHLLFDLNRRPRRLNQETKGTLIGPFYKKIDGITMILARIGQRIYVKTAKRFDVYRVIRQEGGGPFDDFELEGEFIEETNCLILHSIYRLGELQVPTFMKDIEREFVDKYELKGIDFKIYSKRGFVTIDKCLTEKEEFGDYSVTLAEGVLGFVENKKYMVAGKVMETLDIKAETANNLKEMFLQNYDLDIHVTNIDGNICEYALLRQKEVIYLKAIKVRHDKYKENNYTRCCEMIMNLISTSSHELVDYLSADTLTKYGITFGNMKRENDN